MNQCSEQLTLEKHVFACTIRGLYTSVRVHVQDGHAQCYAIGSAHSA